MLARASDVAVGGGGADVGEATIERSGAPAGAAEGAAPGASAGVGVLADAGDETAVDVGALTCGPGTAVSAAGVVSDGTNGVEAAVGGARVAGGPPGRQAANARVTQNTPASHGQPERDVTRPASPRPPR